MDFVNSFSKSAPIHSAVQLIKQLPITHQFTAFYQRSSRNELVFLGAATFITLYNLSSYIKSKTQKLNLPPTVPFALPFVGHNLYTILMPNKFIDWCNNKYGELYILKILGRDVVVASGKCAEEAMKSEPSDLSLQHGVIEDILHFHYVFEQTTMDIGTYITPSIAKLSIPSQKMSGYVPGIQRGLDNASKDLLNDNKPTIIQKPSVFLQDFVAYMTVPTLIGEEVATNLEVIKSFADFTGDVTGNVGIFLAVPEVLHRFIVPYLQSSLKHHKTMEKHIIPVVHQRREKMKAAEEAGKEHGLEYNFLQGFMEWINTDKDGNKSQYSDEQISHAVLLVAFASVHTTSTNLSYCLYWLIARPEFKKKMMEEIELVLPGDSLVTREALGQMQFMNNFVREALRQGSSMLAHRKKAMNDYTFYNGYQIPKDSVVECNLRQLSFGDNQTRSRAEDMDPNMSQNKLSTNPARDFVTFGSGRHLCPGRFFAVQEIQMSLVYLLKNFDIDTVSGKKPHPVPTIAGTISTTCKEPLIFTPRK